MHVTAYNLLPVRPLLYLQLRAPACAAAGSASYVMPSCMLCTHSRPTTRAAADGAGARLCCSLPAACTSNLPGPPPPRQADRSRPQLTALAHWFARGVKSEPEARLVVAAGSKDDRTVLAT